MPNVDPVILKLEADLRDYKRDLAGAQRLTDDKLDAIEKRGARMGEGLKAGFNMAKSAAIGFATGVGFDMLVGAIKDGLEYASSLGEISQQLGVTTHDLQLYRFMATQVGVSQDEMDGGLQKLTKSLGEAATGNKTALAAFDKLGVSIKDSNGQIRSAGEILPDLADGFQRLGSDQERAAVAQDLFSRAGFKMLPFLSGGAKGVRDLADEYAKMNSELTPEQIANADRAADAFAKLKKQLQEKIAQVVGDNAGAIEELANRIINLADKIELLIGKIQRLANSPIGQVVGKINSTLSNLIPGKALLDGVEYFSRTPATPAAKSTGGASRQGAPASGTGWSGAKLAPSYMRTQLGGDGGFSLGKTPLDGITPGTLIDGLAAISDGYDQIFTSALDATDAQRAFYDGTKGFNAEDIAAELDVLIQRTDDYKTTAKDALGEVQQAYRSIVDDGLNSLADGITGAIMGTQSLGDAFSNVAKQIIADLIRIAVQRSIVEPLANSLFGGSGGGIVSAIGSIFGRASGGHVNAGQMYRVNEGAGSGRVEGFVPQGSGHVIPLGKMNTLQGGSGATVVQHFNLDARGAVMTQDIVNQINAMGQQAAIAGAKGGHAMAQRDLANMQRPKL